MADNLPEFVTHNAKYSPSPVRNTYVRLYFIKLVTFTK